MTTPATDRPVLPDLSSWVEGMREAAAVGARAFQAMGDALLQTMWPESFRALQRARERYERAERIARLRARPLAIDGHAYRRRTRRRRR